MKDLVFKTIMLKGEQGGTIARIEKTGSSLNVDTYTITLNDGETSTFEVTNGTSIASIAKTGTSEYTDTYTITLTDDTTFSFDVENGRDGAPGYEVPAGGVIFYDSNDAIPEGYEATGNPESSRIPYSIYADNVSVTFASGAATLSLESLGLANKTIVMVQAATYYGSASIGANCYCVCQILADGINIYIRDGVNNAIPDDGTYIIGLIIAYT